MIGYCRVCGGWAGLTRAVCRGCEAEDTARRAALYASNLRVEAERRQQYIQVARIQREHELIAQARPVLIASVTGLSAADVETSLRACLEKLRAAHPMGFYPESLQLELTVVRSQNNQSILPAFGGLPDRAASPLAMRIAYTGLEHWKAGSGSCAEDLIRLILNVVNSGEPPRTFFRNSPCAITDARWVEVIYTTCAMAIYAEGRVNEDLELFPFLQVDSFACKCKHGSLDRFTALATDECWRYLQPPFDWLCGCVVMPLMEMDVPRPKYARSPGLPRLSTQRIQKAHSWMNRSPETAFHLL